MPLLRPRGAGHCILAHIFVLLDTVPGYIRITLPLKFGQSATRVEFLLEFMNFSNAKTLYWRLLLRQDRRLVFEGGRFEDGKRILARLCAILLRSQHLP